MSPNLRRRLAAWREERIQKAAKRFVNSDDSRALISDLEEIAACSQLLSAMERRYTWIWPVSIAVACIAVAGALWSTRIPRSNISMAVDSDSVRLTLAKPWRSENTFHSSFMRLDRLTTIEAPNLGLALDDTSNDAWVELAGGRIDLATIEIERDAELELYTDGGIVTIYASRAPLKGKITIAGNTTLLAGPRVGVTTVNTTSQTDIPETIEFTVAKPQSSPSRMTVHAQDRFDLGSPQAAQINFTHEDVVGADEATFSSGIKSGTIRFRDTAWAPLQLREEDRLAMRPSESAALRIRGSGGEIHLILNGPVADLLLGDSHRATELAPSYLEYLYNERSLYLFWGAIVFLWGVLWSVRNTVRH